MCTKVIEHYRTVWKWVELMSHNSTEWSRKKTNILECNSSPGSFAGMCSLSCVHALSSSGRATCSVNVQEVMKLHRNEQIVSAGGGTHKIQHCHPASGMVCQLRSLQCNYQPCHHCWAHPIHGSTWLSGGQPQCFFFFVFWKILCMSATYYCTQIINSPPSVTCDCHSEILVLLGSAEVCDQAQNFTTCHPNFHLSPQNCLEFVHYLLAMWEGPEGLLTC